MTRDILGGLLPEKRADRPLVRPVESVVTVRVVLRGCFRQAERRHQISSTAANGRRHTNEAYSCISCQMTHALSR